MEEAVKTLPPALYFPALMIAVSLLGSAVLIIGYFVRDWKTNQEKKDAEQDRAIDNIRQDIADFKALIPRQYVHKDDFIRVVAGLDAKIDKVYSEVSEISKNLNKLIGGAQG